jgi:hypothetical protein
MEEARHNGGKHRKEIPILPMTTPDCRLTNPKDVIDLLASTISKVRKGMLDVKRSPSGGPRLDSLCVLGYT